MTIFIVEIYWIDVAKPQGSESVYLRSCVVVRNDALNQSQIGKAIVCPLTTNLRRAKVIGKVLFKVGEGNLNESSVVNVSQVFTVDKRLLTESIGRLSREKIKLIIQGIKLVIEPQELE